MFIDHKQLNGVTKILNALVEEITQFITCHIDEKDRNGRIRIDIPSYERFPAVEVCVHANATVWVGVKNSEGALVENSLFFNTVEGWDAAIAYVLKHRANKPK